MIEEDVHSLDEKKTNYDDEDEDNKAYSDDDEIEQTKLKTNLDNKSKRKRRTEVENLEIQMKGWSADRKSCDYLNFPITHKHGGMASLSPADFLMTSIFIDSHNLTASTEQEIMVGYNGHRDIIEEGQGVEEMMGLDADIFSNFCDIYDESINISLV